MLKWWQRFLYRGRYLVTIGNRARFFRACGEQCAKYAAWQYFDNGMSYKEFCNEAVARKVN